jgi:hypothetical protein
MVAHCSVILFSRDPTHGRPNSTLESRGCSSCSGSGFWLTGDCSLLTVVSRWCKAELGLAELF